MTPEDVVFVDPEGVTSCPSHMVEEVLKRAEETHIHDEWTQEKLKSGKHGFGNPIASLEVAMSHQSEPLALQLYRRFRSGKSVEQLAAETAIPIDRVRLRVQAGAAFWKRCVQSDGSSLRCL